MAGGNLGSVTCPELEFEAALLGCCQGTKAKLLQ